MIHEKLAIIEKILAQDFTNEVRKPDTKNPILQTIDWKKITNNQTHREIAKHTLKILRMARLFTFPYEQAKRIYEKQHDEWVGSRNTAEVQKKGIVFPFPTVAIYAGGPINLVSRRYDPTQFCSIAIGSRQNVLHVDVLSPNGTINRFIEGGQEHFPIATTISKKEEYWANQEQINTYTLIAAMSDSDNWIVQTQTQENSKRKGKASGAAKWKRKPIYVVCKGDDLAETLHIPEEKRPKKISRGRRGFIRTLHKKIYYKSPGDYIGLWHGKPHWLQKDGKPRKTPVKHTYGKTNLPINNTHDGISYKVMIDIIAAEPGGKCRD